MGKAITQIKLSTGKVINIPIFPYHKESDRMNEKKIGGIIYAVREHNGVSTPIRNGYLLTDDELIEFFNMLRPVNHASSIIPNPSPWSGDGIRVFAAYWRDTNGTGNYSFEYTRGYIYPDYDIHLAYGRLCYTAIDDLTPSDVDFPAYGQPFANGNGIIPFDQNSVYKVSYDNYITPGQEVTEPHRAFNANVSSNYLEKYYKGNEDCNFGISDTMSYDRLLENVTSYATSTGKDIVITTFDPDNPYGYETSTIGGGDGRIGGFDPNGVDPAEVPALPQLSASDIGFMSVYNPTTTQLKALSAFLWSSAFDIDSFKKLFSDPMQCIIGLGVVPVQPTLGGSKNVTFGDIDSGVSMSYISTEYVEKDMGYVSIDKLYGSFMDYNNTSIQIYLPYIGFRQLKPDDLIGGSIGVVYHINVIDGGCTAYIRHSSRGVLYQYSGSCIANVPLSAVNYSGAIQNAVSAAINGGAVIAGIATGAAPVSFMGAAGLVSNAANLAMNSKEQVQRSGSVSGSAGLMGIQRPYIIIERAHVSVPDNMNKFVGNTSNITVSLSSCSGFTIIDHIHLDNVPCTESERDELEAILHKGVIL